MAMTSAERSRRYRERQRAKRDAPKADNPATETATVASNLATLDAARARRWQADAELKELAAAKARGELVARALLEKSVAAAVGLLGSAVRDVPARLAVAVNAVGPLTADQTLALRRVIRETATGAVADYRATIKAAMLAHGAKLPRDNTGSERGT